MIKKKVNLFSIAGALFWQTAGFFLAAVWLVYRFLLPHRPGSHPLSRFFRKLFERKKAGTKWGLLLLLFILLANFYLLPLSSLPYLGQQEVLAAPEPENVVTTESTCQQPVIGWLSQKFHWYHQGIDLAAEVGKEVYPISGGRVVNVQHTKWGYGHFVVVEHPNNHQSLYAHFDQIYVQPNQEVDKDTPLGTIGLTGFTTGPHLHLEVWENHQPIDPLAVLPENNL